MRVRIAAFLVTLSLVGCGEDTTDAVAPLVLVKDGQSQAVVVLPEDADEREQTAAKELVTYIEKISGAELRVVNTGTKVGKKTFGEPIKQMDEHTRALHMAQERRSQPHPHVSTFN